LARGEKTFGKFQVGRIKVAAMPEALHAKAQTNGNASEKKLKKRKRENGNSEPTKNNVETKLLKDGRQEAKRSKKLEKEIWADAKSEEQIPASDRPDEEDKAAAKSLRKAERARLKATKKVEKKGSNGTVLQEGPLAVNNNAAKNPKNKSETTRQSTTGYTEDPALTALPQSQINDFLSTKFIKIQDPASTPLRPITEFSYLPLTTTSDSSSFTSFSNPTPIQSAAWPFLLSGRDVIGVAETGSGKTLAFGVPCIRSITSSPEVPKSHSPARAVIVSPTRELAVQIHTQIEQLATPASLSTVCVYGGVPKDAQRTALKTAHIIVATPGRLNDLIDEGAADLSSVNYLVLDEADRMLDKGFEQEIRKIIATTPTKGRQTLMFTATWPPSVRELAATFMTQPVHISIGADNPTGELRANTKIKQLVEVVDPRGKEQRLLQLLKQYTAGGKKDDRILIFCLYKKEAARVEGFLRSRGLKVAGIHGDMGQAARTASFESFRSGESPLLVATDVAARGWDIPNVKVVVNVTFPLTVEDYVHRIGRTGRAGAEGLAITLFTEHDKGLSGALINVLRAAGQEIPDDLLKFGSTVKKKGHEAYGAFYKDVGEGEMKKAKKIVFD
jgi:ATP-dependent RNA helicase DBP3